MAAPIYVRTKELVISDAKKASSCIEDAISAMSKVDNAVSGWDLYIDAAADGFVFAKSESEVGACLSALRTKQTQLDKLISVMQTGTEKLEDADAGFKNEITDPSLWERLTNAVGRAIYSSTIGKVDALIIGVAWLGTLFNGDASTTNAITYQHIIDEFDWSRTKLSNEDIKRIVDAERKLAEMKGEKLTDQRIRECLQAVYDEHTKELSAYEKYRSETDKITEKVPVGQKQETERSGSGLCTYSVTTTLLQRKQASEGKPITFTFGDVHKVNGGSGRVDSDGIWPDSSYAFGRTYKAADGSSYTMSYINGNSSSSQIVNLLDSHPEGVIVYSPSYGGWNHAIVITDYEITPDGNIQFFADDPVNDARSYGAPGRVKLEDTWLYTKNKDIFGSTVRVAYFD